MDNKPLKSSTETSKPSGTVDRAASQAEPIVNPQVASQSQNSTLVQHQARVTIEALEKYYYAESSGRKNHRFSMLPPLAPPPAGSSDGTTSSVFRFPSDKDTPRSSQANLSSAKKRSAESFIVDSEGVKRRRKSSGCNSNASVNNDDTTTTDLNSKSNTRAPTPTSTTSSKPRSLIKATGLVHGGSAAGPSTVALSSKTTSNSSVKPPSSSSSTSSKPSVSKPSSKSTPAVPSSERARQGLKHLLASAAKLKGSSTPSKPATPSLTNTVKSKLTSKPASTSAFTSTAALTLGTPNRSSSSINLDPPIRTSSSSLSKPTATATPAPIIVDTVAAGPEPVPAGSPTHTNTDIHQGRMRSQKSSLASISPSRRTISSSSSASAAAAAAAATEPNKEKLPKKTPSISGSSKPIASSSSRTPSPSKLSLRPKFAIADVNTKTSGLPVGREGDDEDETQTTRASGMRFGRLPVHRPENWGEEEDGSADGGRDSSQGEQEVHSLFAEGKATNRNGKKKEEDEESKRKKKMNGFMVSSSDDSGDEHGKGKPSPRKGKGKGKAKKTYTDLETDSTENDVQINSLEMDVEMADVTSSTPTPAAASASASVTTATTPALEPSRPLPITPSRSIESMTPGRYNALIAMESAASARLSGMASPSLSRSASGSGSGSALNLAAPLTSFSLDGMQQQQEQQQKELEKQGHKQEEMFKQQQEMMAGLKEQQEMFSRFETSHRELVDRLEVSQKQWLDKLEMLQDERLLAQETRLLSGLETIHQRKLAELERVQEERLSGLETRQDAFFARVEALQGGLEGRLMDGLNVRLKDNVGLADRELGVQMTLLKDSQKEAQKEMEERFIGTFEDWNGRHEAKLLDIQTKGVALVDWVKGQIDGMDRRAEERGREVDEQRRKEVEQRRKEMEEMENSRAVKREEEEHRLTENILRMFTEEKEGRRVREEKEDEMWRVFEERWRVAGEREEKRDEEVRALKRTLDAMSEREKAASVDAKKDIKDVGRALGILAERVENVGRDVGVALSVLGVEPSAKEKDPRVIDGDANMEVGGSQESPIVIDGDSGEVNGGGEGGETFAERGRKRRRLANGDAVSPLVTESQGGNANVKTRKSVLARLENMEMDLQECLERLTDPMAAGAGDVNLTSQDAEKHDSLDVDPTKDQAQQGPSQDRGAESHTDNEDIQITAKEVVRHEMGVSPIRGNAADDRVAPKAATFPEDLAKEIKDILLRTLLENGIVVSKTDRAERGGRRNEPPSEDVFGTVTVNSTPDTQMGPDEGGSFGDQGIGRVEGKGKGKERTKDVGVNSRDVGGTGVGDDEEGSEASWRRGEGGEGDDQRNDGEKRVEVDPSSEDIIMHDHSVASSSCTTRKDESRARGRSHTRKPRASNPDFVKGTLAKSGFSPVDWSKPRVESSREGARVLSLSPHAKLILSPPMTKGSGRGVGSISPSPSIYGSMRNGAGSPANALLKSRSSSFSGRSPNPVSRTYALPPQREGSIAALRQVVLGTPFPDKVVFEGSRVAGASGGMDVDVDAAKEANDPESESESGGVNREKVMSDLQPTDDESAPIFAQAPDVRDNGNGNPPIPDPVQMSGPEIGRTSSSLSWSSLSTLTSVPSSSSMSARSESPEKAVGTSASIRQSGNVPSTLASTSSSGHTRVIDLKTIKFGPPKKKTLIGASPTPTKTSFAVPGPVSRAKHVSPLKKSSPKVSTPTPAQRSEQPPSSQTPVVLSQSSQTTVDEESIAQDLIMTASTDDFEQEDIEQFSSLVRPSVDDDISVGTSLGTHAVDSQSQIESAHDKTPRRQRVDQDDLEDDRASPVPSNCSQPMLKKNVNEQSDAQTLKSARHNDDQHFDSPEPPSQFQSQPADHPPSPSPEPIQRERSPSHPSDITTGIVQVKRELDSAAPMEVEKEDERTSLPVKHTKSTRQPSSSTQRASVVDDKKGKGKRMERNSVLADDVISISSDSDNDIIETTQPKFKGKGKGKEKEKTTPAPSEPAPSQQKPRPKPVPTKRKASTKLNVIEKPPPEVVDLTTPVKQPPKAKPKGKGNENPIVLSPSPMAVSSSSVKRTRSSRMMDDDGSNVQQPAVAEPELEPEPEPELVQQPARRPAAAKKGKPTTPLAVKKYKARLAADEDSDEADIIPVKQKKPPPQASTSSAAGSAVKNEPAEESGSIPPEAGAGGKTRLMGILAGKAKQSAAMTRVVKRKRTPEPENADGDTVVVQQPPLKRAKARMGSTTSTSTSVTEKAKEAKSKPSSKVKTESLKGKEKEDESGNRYPLRSPRKDPSIGGISNASVSTPKKKKPPVVWPKVENPNFVTFVNCDMCDKWYHIGCVGVEPGDRRLRDTEVYCCPVCAVGLAKEDSPIKSPSKTHKEVAAYPKSRPARCSRRGCLNSKEVEETFIVEAFIGRHKKVVGGQGITYEYLVKWLNYPYAESTWETIQGMGMADPTKLLERFERATADDGIDLENAPGEVVLLKAAAEAGWTEDKIFVPKA